MNGAELSSEQNKHASIVHKRVFGKIELPFDYFSAIYNLLYFIPILYKYKYKNCSLCLPQSNIQLDLLCILFSTRNFTHFIFGAISFTLVEFSKSLHSSKFFSRMQLLSWSMFFFSYFSISLQWVCCYNRLYGVWLTVSP